MVKIATVSEVKANDIFSCFYIFTVLHCLQTLVSRRSEMQQEIEQWPVDITPEEGMDITPEEGVDITPEEGDWRLHTHF